MKTSDRKKKPTKIPDAYVLCIEDSRADGDMMSHFFSHQPNPLHAIVCRNGLDAKSYLEELDPNDKLQLPNFVVCDLNLPGWNGLEILSWFKAQALFDTIPFFIFSTSSDKDAISQAHEAGADGYFVKPVDVDDFEQATQLMRMRSAELLAKSTLHHSAKTPPS